MDTINWPLAFLIICALVALLAKKNGHSWYLFFFAASVPSAPLLLLLPHVLDESISALPAVRLATVLVCPVIALVLGLRQKVRKP